MKEGRSMVECFLLSHFPPNVIRVECGKDFLARSPNCSKKKRNENATTLKKRTIIPRVKSEREVPEKNKPILAQC